MADFELCSFANDANCQMKLPAHEFTERFKTRNEHEEQFRKICTYLIQNGHIKNIVDLGAWIGDNSLPWAINSSGTIYAIDPSEQNCQFIQQLKDLNNTTNLIIIQKAISDKEEKLYTQDDLTHACFNNQNHGSNTTMAVTLNSLKESGEIKNVDFIHLDVEGMEAKVLAGSSKLLDERPVVAFEQHIWSDKYSIICQYLRQLDYRVYLINEILKGCNLDCRNFIAFPKSRFDEYFAPYLQNNINYNPLNENLFIEMK